MNKKGMTVVEMVVSIALISIVLLFLFRLIINIRNQEIENNVESMYVLAKSTLEKKMGLDFIKRKLRNVELVKYVDDTTNIPYTKVTFTFNNGSTSELLLTHGVSNTCNSISYGMNSYGKEIIDLTNNNKQITKCSLNNSNITHDINSTYGIEHFNIRITLESPSGIVYPVNVNYIYNP